MQFRSSFNNSLVHFFHIALETNNYNSKTVLWNVSIVHYPYFALLQQVGILFALVNDFRRIRKIILKVLEFFSGCFWWTADSQKYKFVFAKMYWTFLRSLVKVFLIGKFTIRHFPSKTEDSRPIKFLAYLSLLPKKSLNNNIFSVGILTRPKNKWNVQKSYNSRTQSPSYARWTERDEVLWPNPYQTGIWLATTKVIVLIPDIFYYHVFMVSGYGFGQSPSSRRA
jgi:hypothetical protein